MRKQSQRGAGSCLKPHSSGSFDPPRSVWKPGSRGCTPVYPRTSKSGVLPEEPFLLAEGFKWGCGMRLEGLPRSLEADSGGKSGSLWLGLMGGYTGRDLGPTQLSRPPSSQTRVALKALRGTQLVPLPPLLLQLPKPFLTFPKHKSARSLPCCKPSMAPHSPQAKAKPTAWHSKHTIQEQTFSSLPPGSR